VNPLGGGGFAGGDGVVEIERRLRRRLGGRDQLRFRDRVEVPLRHAGRRDA
jgi:hypothetical protein